MGDNMNQYSESVCQERKQILFRWAGGGYSLVIHNYLLDFVVFLLQFKEDNTLLPGEHL